MFILNAFAARSSVWPCCPSHLNERLVSCCIIFDSRDTKLRTVKEEPGIPVLTMHVAVLMATAQYSESQSQLKHKIKQGRATQYGTSRIRTEIDKLLIGDYTITPKGPYQLRVYRYLIPCSTTSSLLQCATSKGRVRERSVARTKMDANKSHVYLKRVLCSDIPNKAGSKSHT